jgi:hypothetical protein
MSKREAKVDVHVKAIGSEYTCDVCGKEEVGYYTAKEDLQLNDDDQWELFACTLPKGWSSFKIAGYNVERSQIEPGIYHACDEHNPLDIEVRELVV